MQALQSYPVFEADQVLSNAHLNNLLNYLEQQERLSRIKLLGRGIVCGLEINSSDQGISISKGIALSSQGYLLQLCDTLYTHFIPYVSPELPNDLYFLKQCGDIQNKEIPYYSKDNVLELVPETDKEVENKKSLNTLSLQDYAVVLFLEAEQIDLKNCDTQDCNDKGSRIDFIIKPLLVRRSDLNTSRKISFHSILLKRFNVPVAEMATTTDILQGFLDITDDTTLGNLSKNLTNSWERFAVPLGLPKQNPFKGLNLINQRKKLETNPTQRIYIQYFYDFIDDLLKAYIEFRSKVREVFGECCPDEMDFPLHINLGLADQNTVLGRKNTFRQYFEPSPIINGQDKKSEEAALLLERLVAMVEGFSIDELNPQDPIVITPTNLGHEYISYRAIPYYYDWNRLNPFWYFNRSYSGNEAYNLGYRAAAQTNAPEPVKNPLLYDIERFDSFRVEGHIGINYRIALRELINKKQSFNLPFDVLALNAIDLTDILNGRNVKCHIEDLESDYRVMITGIICQLQQIIEYVGNLRPQRTITETFTTAQSAKSRDFYISRNLTDMQKTIKKDVSKNQPISITNADIINNLALKNAEPGDKLADLVAMDVGNFIVNHKALYEYIIKQPDLLLIFLKQLAEIVKYLLAHDLHTYDEDGYGKIWKPYSKTVEKLMDEAENSNNPEIQRYFSKSNYELYFKCFNEKLFALKEEFRQRLGQYHAAVNFNEYFKKHPGMEHKAGVPKGGTFILVYHGVTQQAGIQSNFNLFSDLSNSRTSAMLAVEKDLTTSTRSEAINVTKNTSAADFQNLRKTEYALASNLIKNLNLEFDVSKVLEALAARDQEVRDQPLRIPTGTVIADFYLPYICCSDCQPIAYVIPDEPQPEPIQPSLSMDQTEFCDNDRSSFPIHVAPEGGVLSINGATSERLEINPSQLGAGQFQLSYEVEGQIAELDILVASFRSANVELTEVTFDRELGWTLLLDPGIGNEEINHTWQLNGNDLADKGVLSQNFAMARGEAEISLMVQNQSPCQSSTSSYELEFMTQGIGICGRPEDFRHSMQGPSEVHLVDPHPDVKVEGNMIIFSPGNILDNVGDSFTLPVFQRTESTFILTLLAFTYLDASFNISFRQATESGPPNRPPVNRGGLAVTMNALLPIGESTWTFNGENTEPEFLIPVERFREIREIVLTHNIVVNEFDCSDEKTFRISIEELAERLTTGNGTYETSV